MEPEEQNVDHATLEDFSIEGFIVDNELEMETDTDTDLTESESGPSRRERIIMELRSTENSFVEFLTILNVFFYKPLLLDLQRNPESSMLSEADINTIFKNFKKILDLNSALLRKIQKVCDAPGFSYESSLFADIFVECFNDPAFPVQEEYQVYTNNYNNSLTCLVHHQKTNERFQHFTQEALKKHVGFANLQSYLITPVQRLPRYVMMLNDLRKHTSPEHPDTPFLIQAVNQILEITKQIDAGKDFFEEFMRKEILFKKFTKMEQALIKPLVNAEERIVTEAPLLEMSKGKLLLRYVIVTSNYIIITRKKSDTVLKLCYSLGILSCNVRFDEDAKTKSKFIEISYNDPIDTVPFVRKLSHTFMPVTSKQFGWGFWERTLKQCTSRIFDAEALMLRSTATKSHLQTVLLTAHHWDLISIGAQQQDHEVVGAELVTEGQMMDHVFYIRSGAVDVVKVIDGEQKVLVSMCEGSFVGDISFLTAIKTRTTTAATATIVTSQPGTSVIKISHDQLLSTLDEQHEIAWRFYFLMSALFGERLIRVNSILSQNMSFGDARKITNRSLSVANLQSSSEKNQINKPDSITKDAESIVAPSSPALEKKGSVILGSLSKKYSSVEKVISEAILEEMACKFQVGGSSHTGSLLLSRNHLCFYRKVFGKKTQIVIPGVALLDVKMETPESKEVIIRYLAVGKNKSTDKEVSNELDIHVSFRATKMAKEACASLRKFTQEKRSASIEWSKLPSKGTAAFEEKAGDMFQGDQVLLRGHVAVQPGLLLDCVYQLSMGTCRVEIQNSDGKRQVVGSIETGETFGELSFLLGTVSSAYVIVDSDSAIISKCSWAQLAAVTANDQEAAVTFYRFLAQMLCKRFLAAERKAVRGKTAAPPPSREPKTRRQRSRNSVAEV